MKKASEIINELLEHLGKTPSEIAKEIGIGRPQRIYDIQNDKVKNVSKNLISILKRKYININEIFLLTGEGSPLILEENDNTKDETDIEKLRKNIIEKDKYIKSLELNVEHLEYRLSQYEPKSKQKHA